MKLQVLGTGSRGNCFALSAGRDTILLDAGLPAKRISIEVTSFPSIRGCFVTHEHKDHGAGVEGLAARGIDIYASAGTFDALGFKDTISRRIKPVEAGACISCGGFRVVPFAVQHDAAQPFGYLVQYEPTKERLVFATDTYYLRYVFPNVNYWLVECNNIEEIVNANVDAADETEEFRHRLNRSHMNLRRLLDTLNANDLTSSRFVILCHLSDINSDEDRMIVEIQEKTGIPTLAAVNGEIITLSEANNGTELNHAARAYHG